MDLHVLLTGFLIFSARIVDVSLGTLRTVSIVNGRMKTAFFLGFLEIYIWLFVISTVITKIYEKPILSLFYALGFASGNVVGIMLERVLPIGFVAIRAITVKDGKMIAEQLRNQGYSVTTFQGEGLKGPVHEIFLATRKKEIRKIVQQMKALDPNIFYVTEYANMMSGYRKPGKHTPTGWRAIFKKK